MSCCTQLVPGSPQSKKKELSKSSHLSSSGSTEHLTADSLVPDQVGIVAWEACPGPWWCFLLLRGVFCDHSVTDAAVTVL